MPTISKALLTSCSMKRIICHWSEGNYKANSTDLEHYHLLIEGDGTVRGGDHGIRDNVSTADGGYAAHTFNCNTGSIGVACCCMVGCQESPFRPGPQPLKKAQWDVMVQVVAELCLFYKIPVTPTTVLGHGEVQKNLGIKQKSKWDPMVWPWDTSKTAPQVGEALRQQVAAALARLQGGEDPCPTPVDLPLDVALPGNGSEPGPAPGVSPGEGSYPLCAPLLAGDPALQKIAAGSLVLAAPAQSERVAGISTIQEALNRLALHGAAIPPVQLGAGGKYRGFFGGQTVAALRAFQRLSGIGADGRVGDDTHRALDAALATAGLGGVSSPLPAGTGPVSAPVTPPPPVISTATTILVMPGVPTDLGAPAEAFQCPAASSRTRDGRGTSRTGGLRGSLYRPAPHLEVIVAEELLEATRDACALGTARRPLRQQRVIDVRTGTIVVQQPDYCWSDRKLPNAILFTNHAGFDKSAGIIEGEASYFGKFDTTDEGTGTPVFGIVQTNSSVFGVSLPEPLLLQFGLACREGKYLRKTEKSYGALVEVYYAKTKRLVRVPVVDVGPQVRLKRPADLTVAAAAFLQNEPEEKANRYRLPNIPVQLRVL